MSLSPAFAAIHDALPMPRRGAQVYRIEMTDAVTGRDIRMDIVRRPWGSPATVFERAARWFHDRAPWGSDQGASCQLEHDLR